MIFEPYEAFYDRLAVLPDEVLFEASKLSEDEREHGYEDEDGDHGTR